MGFQGTAQVYASPADLALCGLPPGTLDDVAPDAVVRALYQASRTADTKIAARYQLPLVSWGDDLTQLVCVIAGYRLKCFEGWNPNDPNNAGVVQMYKEAMQLLKEVADGEAELDVVDTSPEPTGQPRLRLT